MWQSHLSSHTPAYGAQLQQALAANTQALQMAGVPALEAAAKAQGMIYNQLTQQAHFLAYIDSFQLMWIIMMVLAPLALFLPGRNPARDILA
jgi:hypothetical protein